jgi:hypothetical protein
MSITTSMLIARTQTPAGRTPDRDPLHPMSYTATPEQVISPTNPNLEPNPEPNPEPNLEPCTLNPEPLTGTPLAIDSAATTRPDHTMRAFAG